MPIDQILMGFKTLEEAEAFRKTIAGEFEIVQLAHGSIAGEPIAYFLAPKDTNFN